MELNTNVKLMMTSETIGLCLLCCDSLKYKIISIPITHVVPSEIWPSGQIHMKPEVTVDWEMHVPSPHGESRHGSEIEKKYVRGIRPLCIPSPSLVRNDSKPNNMSGELGAYLPWLWVRTCGWSPWSEIYRTAWKVYPISTTHLYLPI